MPLMGLSVFLYIENVKVNGAINCLYLLNWVLFWIETKYSLSEYMLIKPTWT